MNFKLKNAAFKVIENVPFGNQLHYFLQKHVTRSLSRSKQSDATYIEKFKKKVLLHIDAFRQLGITDFSSCSYYEFGAGWDLFAPIGFSAAGMKELTVVDLNPLVQTEQICFALSFYNRCAIETGLPAMQLNGQITKENYKEFLSDELRITYKAPYDARRTDLASESIDIIVSNVSLEHIPAKDIETILKECFRITKAGGIVSVTIDYQDHWSYFDHSISVYNYMKYEESEWAKYNPGLHFQNRLRHCDYAEMFKKAGFEIVINRPREVTSDDRKMLSQVKLASCFKNYSEDDLLIREGHFVLRKP